MQFSDRQIARLSDGGGAKVKAEIAKAESRNGGSRQGEAAIRHCQGRPTIVAKSSEKRLETTRS